MVCDLTIGSFMLNLLCRSLPDWCSGIVSRGVAAVQGG